MLSKLPLNTSPNRSFTCSLPLEEGNKTLKFFMHWNFIGEYWAIDIKDEEDKDIITGLPLCDIQPPYANLLRQYMYLQIGSLYLANMDNKDLALSKDEMGEGFIGIWGDNE